MQQFPFFSIIIPTYNRPERLKTCLESLTRLDYPRDRFEVIVVDDGSSTSLEPIVTPFKEQLTIQFIRQDNAGPAYARNRGASEAKGEYIAFTDDDCQPTPGWLSVFARQFSQTPNAFIGGYTINLLSKNIFSEASQELINYLYSYYNSDPQQSYFFASNNIALPTALFHQIGGFDAAFLLSAGEDREFCDRWHYHNYPMIYLPEAQIYHTHQLTLRTFWKQHFNYGRGAIAFHKVRSKRMQKSLRVEPLSFYFRLLTYPLSNTSNKNAYLLSILLFLSQLANATGFFVTFINIKLSQKQESFNQ